MVACVPEPSCSELRTCAVDTEPGAAGSGGGFSGFVPARGGSGGGPPLDGGEAGTGAEDPGAAGAAGAPTSSPSDPLIGTPCSEDGEKRCEEPAGHTIFECVGGAWAHAEDCARPTLCDSRTAECAPIAPGCERLAPGQSFCDGDSLVTCGPDLVTSESSPCEGRCIRNECQSPNCGDGVAQSDEGCDDGNTEDGDDCPSTCESARCGDGFVLEGVETCDDGDSEDGDECPGNCEVARCGDGYTFEGEEECDDGNQDSTDGCLPTCVSARCGDGVIWSGEETCEDDNDDDTDACPTTCRVATCGDGFVLAGEEECDDSNQTPGDGCSSTCQVEPIQLDLGLDFMCAVLSDGRLKCWGNNERGQLGLGSSKATYGKVLSEMGSNLPAVFESGVTAVAAGRSHACALRGGQVYCWGENAENQIGPDAQAAIEMAPVAVAIPGVETISAEGYYTAVKLKSGQVRVWGGGNANPTIVPFSAKAIVVECGDSMVCAILETNAVECWDPANPTVTMVVTASQHGATEPVALTAGVHTCIQGSGEDVYCFGDNAAGNLVSGDAEDRAGNIPMGMDWPRPLLGPDVVQVSASGYVTCAAYRDGTAKCWGNPWYGLLGQPGLAYNDNPLGDSIEETGTNLPPIRLGSEAKVSKIIAGPIHVCALLTDGRVKCWGNNSSGALGNGGDELVGIYAEQLGDNLPETIID